MLKILLFGPARDASGGRAHIDIELRHGTHNVADLRAATWKTFPEMRHVLETSIFAVNNRMVPKRMENMEIILSPQTDIVLVPPVSGG